MAMLVLLTGAGVVFGGTNEISTLLQKGLFEEEANRNLEAAIQAYQAVITQTDKDRQFAATAIFRLGECYRKQGKTNEANMQYQRIVREFADQTELVKLSQGYVGTPAVKQASTPAEQQDGGALTGYAAWIDRQEANEVERIKALIKDSPDLINAKDELGRPPLCNAASKGWTEAAKFLLENKANIEARAHDQTPLMMSVEAGKPDMVDLLLSKRADVNATCPDTTHAPGRTALHAAARAGRKTIAEALLAHGANVNAKDSNGSTPLHLAAQAGYKAVAELLLAHKADFSIKDTSGRAVLDAAVDGGNRSIVEWLLENHADVNSRDSNGKTPLMRAVSNIQIEMVRILLAHGADVKAQIPQENGGQIPKWTALDFAVAQKLDEIAKLLLENHADPNATFEETRREDQGGIPGAGKVITVTGMTPLMLTVRYRSMEIAQILLEHGADANLKNSEGQTALLGAVQQNDEKMVQLLLEHAADANAADKKGNTSLNWEISHSEPQLQIAELLLAHGADANARDESGKSPLHWAIKYDKKAFVESLLAHGADVNLKDSSGNAPLDVENSKYSHPNEMTEIGQLLRRHGALSAIELFTIRVTRKGMESPTIVFRKDANSRNRFTLFELIANAYGPPTWKPNPAQNPIDLPGLPFPDFSKVQIRRLKNERGSNIPSIDVNAALTAGDCSKDVLLEWGDVVEIPELDHNVAQAWDGLSSQFKEMLTKCVERTVDFSVKGEITKVTLVPNLPTFSGRIAPFTNQPRSLFSPVSEGSPVTRLTTFWLNGVVPGAHVILASSDLTRVKVKRVDPSTRKAEEMIFNLEQKNSNSNLWLRDGDVIEIPEKQ
ncbi:MAG: Ankyrin repeat-like protein [Pedosphaera sp.]|nr:Ankyrin repeat-like protein [Pedosphaera sp.]